MKTKILNISELTVGQLIAAGTKGLKVALARSGACTVKKEAKGFSVYTGKTRLYTLADLENVKFCLKAN